VKDYLMRPLSHLNSVLHVEDEMLISMTTDDALHEAGVVKVMHAATIEGALALIQSEVVDAAIVDMQLRDGTSRSVIKALMEKHIPYMIVSGAPPEHEDEELQAFRIDKPATNAQLITALERMTTDALAIT
jgi:DNA-binding NarL/FixJ family response regulator